MKKFFVGVLASGLLLTHSTTTTLAQEVNPYNYSYPVVLNGNYLEFDQPPVNIDGRVLVPIGVIFQELGAEVKWNEKEQSVIATRDEVIVGINIGETIYYRNGQQYSMDVPAQIINGRTMVPISVIAESFGCDIAWNQESSSVILNYSPPPVLLELASNENSRYYSKYVHYRYGETKDDAMYSDGDNGFSTVSLVGDSLQVNFYHNDGVFKNTIDLEMELPLFAGSYKGSDGYYLLFGQDNPDENDNQVVFAVVKYDFNWNKLAVGTVNGNESNTIEPFRSGGAAMSEFQGELYVHTSRLMYESSDGKNHQSNITLIFDTQTLKYRELNNFSDALNTYTSHSFDQYVATDEKGIVFFDHGDAYPRALVLTTFDGKTNKRVSLCEITGATGENYTGASIGGVAVSSSTYLATATRSDLSLIEAFLDSGMDMPLMSVIPSNESRNPYLYIVDRATHEVTELLLDNSDEIGYASSPPRIIPLENETYCLIWTNFPSTSSNISSTVIMDVRYVIIDKNGNFLSEIQVDKNVVFSRHMIPIYHQGKICWFVDNNDVRTLQQCALPEIKNSTNITQPTVSNTITKEDTKEKEQTTINELFALINEEREKVGLSPLAYDETLMSDAQLLVKALAGNASESYAANMMGIFSELSISPKPLQMFSGQASATGVIESFKNTTMIDDFLSKSHKKIGIGFDLNDKSWLFFLG